MDEEKFIRDLPAFRRTWAKTMSEENFIKGTGVFKGFYTDNKYYINTDRAIHEWFSDRGIYTVKDDIKMWCCDGSFLHFIPSKDAPQEIQDGDEDGEVVVCIFNSLVYECSFSRPYEESPFYKYQIPRWE